MSATIRRLFFVACLLLHATPVHAFAPIAIGPSTSKNPTTHQLLGGKSTPTAVARQHVHMQALPTKGFEMASLFYDSTSSAFDAWEWTANLGAPAALVAGAVLVTLSETRKAMGPRKADKNWVRVVKQSCRFLLLSSFALEVVSIFVSTVIGSVLLGHGDVTAAAAAAKGAAKAVGYTSPLGLLRHHHEFEYLTIQITFLQGLLHWLAAVAMEIIIPKEDEGVSAKRMNAFMASCLGSLILWILAFYNHHLNFYSNYMGMIARYGVLFVRRFFGAWPPRPMMFLYGPSFVLSAVLGWRAFNSPPDLDNA